MRIFSVLTAAIMAAALNMSALHAEEFTVNGRPATPKEKAVARSMARQGARMASKGAQLAVAAVTNPKKAEEISREMENMGNEMERLGDSLESLAEDTTFLYGGVLNDSVELADEDTGDFEEELKDAFGLHWDWTDSWWGKLLGGSLGLLGGLLGILIAIFVVLFVFGLLLSPLWLLALIIWLIVRGSRTRPTPAPVASADPAAASTASTAAASQAATPYADGYEDIWRSGIMYCCVGVGLILLLQSLFDGLWGIGALVACIGVAKLVIASTAKRKQHQQPDLSDYTEVTQTEEYTKDEN